MNGLNDSVRSMFDLIGSNLTQLLPGSRGGGGGGSIGGSKQQQPPLKKKSSRSSESRGHCTATHRRTKSNRSQKSITSNRQSLRREKQAATQQSQQRNNNNKTDILPESQLRTEINLNEKLLKSFEEGPKTRTNTMQTLSVIKNSYNANNDDNDDDLYARRLLHSASLTITDERFLDLKTMAANRYACAVYLIHCAHHNRVAVTRPSREQALWMPYLPTPNHHSWREEALTGLLIILSSADMDRFISLRRRPPFQSSALRLLEVLDIQQPQTMTIVTRLTWYIRFERNDASRNIDFRCCTATETLQWLEECDIVGQSGALEYLWGRKLVELYRIVTASEAAGVTPSCSFEELAVRTAFQFVPHSPPANQEEQLLASTNITEQDVGRLYSDYLDHCFPSTTMTTHSFKLYMTRCGMRYGDESIEHYFRAFNYLCTGFITFPEFLLGLACLDVKAIHNETRTKFVFRYYDVRCKGYLDDNDLRILLQDLLESERGPGKFELEDVEQRLEQCRAAFGVEEENRKNRLSAPKGSVDNFDEDDYYDDDFERSKDTKSQPDAFRIGHQAFVKAVGEHRFRGTSRLCRMPRSILAVILHALLAKPQRQSGANTSNISPYAKLIDTYVGICIRCKERRPKLDDLLVRLGNDGYVREVVAHPKLHSSAAAAAVVVAAAKAISKSKSTKQKQHKKQLQQQQQQQQSSSQISVISKQSSISTSGNSSSSSCGAAGGGSRRSNSKSNLKIVSAPPVSPKRNAKTTMKKQDQHQISQKSIAIATAKMEEDVAAQAISSTLTLLESEVSSNVTTTEDEETAELALELIVQIRQFASVKGDTAKPRGIFSATSERDDFANKIDRLERALCDKLRTSGDRLITINSPCYIVGDIHGNLDDLLAMERALWRRLPLVGPNLLFLGDMVDRGKWSVECVLYLIALKLLLPPGKVTLLRGNHEVRDLQLRYTYRAECTAKYGAQCGERIWAATNRIFDHLPLSALIDDKIWCAHGGIPRSIGTLCELATISPIPLFDPEHDCPAAWEILWSDPMHEDLFVEAARLQQLDPAQTTGYLANQKRGTAYAFNESAIDRFIAANRISHVVRAHEVPANGFFFHFGKKCCTIFSCSHYCGNNNECAVLLADRDTIRVIGIDTSANPSATD